MTQHETDRERAIHAAWERGTLECDACQRIISQDGRGLIVRAGMVRHAACAARATETRGGGWYDARSRTTTSPTSPTCIGVIEGVALEFETPCFLAKSDRHELFKSGSLDAGLNFGGQTLLMDHTGPPLSGRFQSLAEDARRLRFRFELYDGPRERELMGQVRSGKMAGCSVGFRPDISAWAETTLEHTRVHLDEVSLLTSGRPGWYGTWCRAAP